MAIQVEYRGMARSGLYGLGRKMGAAITRFLKAGPERIDLKRTDAKSFSDDFLGATGTEDEFQICRVMKSGWIKKRRTAEKVADRFIGKLKGELEDVPEFGLRWNLSWLQLGFKTPGTIETPSDPNDKMEILRSAAVWLSKNPDMEVREGKFIITHERAGELEQALSDAISKVDDYDGKIAKCDDLRQVAEETFKNRIAAVINELDFLLDPLDSRWISFGLNKPGETQRPEQPQDVQATLIARNRLHLTWGASARRSRYKVRVLIVGRDKEYVTVTEVFEEEVELTFEPGQTVKVQIVAANGAGDSAPSAMVERLIAVAAA